MLTSKGVVRYIEASKVKQGTRVKQGEKVKQGTRPVYLDHYKLCFSRLSGYTYPIPYKGITNTWIAPPGMAVTDSFLFIPFEDEQTAKKIDKYMRTKLFNFLNGQLKYTSQAPAKAYGFVPWIEDPQIIDNLYEYYGFTDYEIKIIENRIRFK